MVLRITSIMQAAPPSPVSTARDQAEAAILAALGECGLLAPGWRARLLATIHSPHTSADHLLLLADACAELAHLEYVRAAPRDQYRRLTAALRDAAPAYAATHAAAFPQPHQGEP